MLKGSNVSVDNNTISKKKIKQVRMLLEQGLVDEGTPLVSFVDIEGIYEAIDALQNSFPDNFFHTFAVKANAMRSVLSIIRECGMGAEVASPGEMAQALAAGFKPQDMVFDEPAKTTEVISQALKNNINLNIDNFQEFEEVKLLADSGAVNSRVGFRINPQIGAGSIKAMSTATNTSKFGVPIADEGVREMLIELYCQNPWLTSLHTHVGSQGCPLLLMAKGVKVAADLVEEINARIGKQQITTIDIGGGLSVNFQGEEVTPTFAEYAKVLKAQVPVLFSGKYRVLTEFGRSIMAKNGYIVSRVEYTKVSGGQRIAITHAGAQIAARTVFMPDAWPLRITAHNPDGSLKQTELVKQDIAGPCCFAGDKIADNRELPLLDRNDIVVVHDTGAYYFSNPFYYNSLPAAPVYAVSTEGDDIKIDIIRRAQTIEEMMDVIG